MTDFVASQSFNTTQRRIKRGDPINAGDDLSPHTIESAKAAGLVAEKSAAAAAPARSAARKAGE